jgi:tetratricopeptide (TPR) repeat protein
VLRRLSVFMGGWTLEAAEVVCDNSAMLDLLAHLVDKSLVSVDYEYGEEARYYFLETIRQYAREKLYESGEGEIMRERQARWCVDLAERAEPKLRGHGQLEWLERIEQELDNVRSALEWCLDHNVGLGFRIMNGRRWFWGIRDLLVDGNQYMERLMAAGPFDRTPLHAKSLATATMLAGSHSTMDRMVALADAGIRMSHEVGDNESLAVCIGFAAVAQSWQGNINQAIELFEESLALDEEAGLSWWAQRALLGVGFTLLSQDPERALAALQRSLALSRENGDLDFCQAVL